MSGFLFLAEKCCKACLSDLFPVFVGFFLIPSSRSAFFSSLPSRLLCGLLGAAVFARGLPRQPVLDTS